MNPKKAKRSKRAMSTPDDSVSLEVACWMDCPAKSAAPKITPAVTLLTSNGSVSSAVR